MASQPRLPNFGDYAYRGYVAETRDGLPWWKTCITSALIDLSRVDGFIVAFAGIASALRHGANPDRVIGDDGVRAAIDVTLEWLDEGINPSEVAGWLQAGCWNPLVARKLTAAGIRPHDLLDEQGEPLHWVAAPNGDDIPLAQAVTEWEMPIAAALKVMTDRVAPAQAS